MSEVPIEKHWKWNHDNLLLEGSHTPFTVHLKPVSLTKKKEKKK